MLTENKLRVTLKSLWQCLTSDKVGCGSLSRSSSTSRHWSKRS